MARKYKTSKERRLAQKRYRKSRRQYEDYLEKFEARRENFESRGLEFYDPVPLTYRDYKTVRAEKVNDLRLDVEEGKRKTTGDINREIVYDQAYELSSRQADVLGEYLLENEYETLKEMGLIYKYQDEEGIVRINLKKRIDLMMKIRQGEFIREDIGLWDMINDFRSQYFALDKERQAELMKKWGAKSFSEAVKKEVGATFFNSPH